jgi:hypothetical protein
MRVGNLATGAILAPVCWHFREGQVRIPRRRAVGVIAAVGALALLWTPSIVARSYTNSAQPIDFISRPDKGWRFLYDTVRLSRHAKLGSNGPAFDTARRIWPRAETVELVYLDRPVSIPVPPGGLAQQRPRPVRPRTRLSWFVYGRIGNRPRQVVGLLDFRSGRVVWDLRRVGTKPR